MAQVRGLGPRGGGRLALFCIHRVNRGPHDCSMSHFNMKAGGDGQTDGFTITSTARCIASYDDAL